MVRAYAAPALLGLMAAAIVGVIAWNVNASDQLRAQLANLGIDVSSDGLDAAATARFKVEEWDKAGSLPNRVITLQSLNLSKAKIADVGPLKALLALQSLNLSSTEVANVEPLETLTALQSLDLSNMWSGVQKSAT